MSDWKFAKPRYRLCHAALVPGYVFTPFSLGKVNGVCHALNGYWRSGGFVRNVRTGEWFKNAAPDAGDPLVVIQPAPLFVDAIMGVDNDVRFEARA